MLEFQVLGDATEIPRRVLVAFRQSGLASAIKPTSVFRQWFP